MMNNSRTRSLGQPDKILSCRVNTAHTTAAASMTILTFRSHTSTHFILDDSYDYAYVDSSRDLHFQVSEVPKTVVFR